MDKPVQVALVGAAWILALGACTLGFLAWQRGQDGAAAPPSAPSQAGAPAAGGYAVNPAGQAACPVTGQLLTVTSATPRVVYRGETYYFSGDRDAQGNDARTRFLMDPESFLQRRAGP